MLALCSTPLALRVGSAARSGRGIVRMNANLPTTADVTDVREWLEEVEGEDALAWVKEQNADAISTFGEPSAQPLYSRILASLESDEKIPYIGRVLNGDAFYNFWTDADHVRGIWRRCSLAEYRKPEPNWEVVLDLDALGADEGVSWERFNLAKVHNGLVANTSLQYDPQVVNASGPRDHTALPTPQTSSYTGLVEADDGALVVSYDRIANGWHGPPGVWGAADTLFTVRVSLSKS